jgi:hypothetical protein
MAVSDLAHVNINHGLPIRSSNGLLLRIGCGFTFPRFFAAQFETCTQGLLFWGGATPACKVWL